MASTISPITDRSIAGYRIRPYEPEDIPAVHALFQAGEAYEDRGWFSAQEEYERDYVDEHADPARNARLVVAEQTGEIAAFAWVDPPLKSAAHEYKAFLFGEVHPAHRNRGLGTFNMEWMEARARQILAELPADLPKLIQVNAAKHLVDRISLFQAHGFNPSRHFYKMRRDLHLPIADHHLPAGITLHRWSPELDEVALQVFNEAFLDHWGFEQYSPEMWKTWISGYPNFLPECSFLALDGDRAAGMCVCMDNKEDNLATGLNEAWIQDVGTLRPYRRRGIAAALMTAALNAFVQAGFTSAGLGVDTANPTGALGIYERLGFSARQEIIAFTKDVERSDTGTGV